MWEDDTMWKYRDLSMLVTREYFLSFVKKYEINYFIVNNNIVFAIDKYIFRIYGYTIENCLYMDVFDFENKKIESFSTLRAILFNQDFIIDFYKKEVKLFNETNFDAKIERDFFYSKICFLNNFYDCFFKNRIDIFFDRAANELQCAEYEKLVKEYYPDLYDKYRKK